MEEPKSKEQARNILGTCLQHACDYGGDLGVLRCWQGEACGLRQAGWRGCVAATAFRWWCQDAPARRLRFRRGLSLHAPTGILPET